MDYWAQFKTIRPHAIGYVAHVFKPATINMNLTQFRFQTTLKAVVNLNQKQCEDKAPEAVVAHFYHTKCTKGSHPDELRWIQPYTKSRL